MFVCDVKWNVVIMRLVIIIDVLFIKLFWVFGVVEMLEYDGDVICGG